jgi:ribonucleotide reductase beta subunit family protein with ferritin-like domain
MAADRRISTPSELYRRWEQQHWQADEIDLTTDAQQWRGLTDEERRKWYWLAGLSHFRESELEAITTLARLVPGLPHADQRCYLGTQIADEARHSRFFMRYHSEVLETAPLSGAPPSMSAAYQELTFDLPRDLSERAAAAPHDASDLARVVVHFFIILEGTLAMATFSTLRRVLERSRIFPGLQQGLTLTQRDEVRHVQFGLSLLDTLFAADSKARDAVAAHVARVLPLLRRIFEPQAGRAAALSTLGLDPAQRRTEAFAHLSRHLGMVGLSCPSEEGALLS